MELLATILAYFPDLFAKYTAIIAAAPEWVAGITTIFMGAKSITLLTKSESDNKIVDMILKVLNFISLNVLKDKNAE